MSTPTRSAKRSTAIWWLVCIPLVLGLGLLWMLQVEPANMAEVAPTAVSGVAQPKSALAPTTSVPPSDLGGVLAERSEARREADATSLAQRDTRPWVEGVVVHAGGEGPIAGVELLVLARSAPQGMGLEPDSTYTVGKGRSGADGRFALARSLIPPSWHRGSLPHIAMIQVDAPGFARFQAPFPPISDAPAAVLVRLVPYPIVVGRVVDPSGKPIPHAVVSNEPPPLVEARPAGVAFTPRQSGDRWGRFRMLLTARELEDAKVTGEAIHLQVRHPAHGRGRIAVPQERLAELDAARGQRDVDLGDVMLVPNDWTEAGPPSLVEGRLVDPEGAAIRGHELRLVGDTPVSGQRHPARTAVTDREGRFCASGLHGEHIAVHSTHQAVRAALRQGDGQEGAIEAGRAARLEWPMHRVRVRVVDQTGAPIPGARVELVPEGAAISGKDLAASAGADDDGNVRDLFARPGTRVQLLAHLPRGQVLRAEVDVPERPHLTTLELVDDGRLPGVLRLTFTPPVTFGRGGMDFAILDSETRRPVVAAIAPVGPGQLDATLPSGAYLLQIVGVPPNFLAPAADTLGFEIAPNATTALTVPIERVARVHVVALDESAEIALRNPVDVGLPQLQSGQLTNSTDSSPQDSALLLRWDPEGVSGEEFPKLRPVHLRGGTYGLRWRWQDGEQWLGEVELRAGALVRVELAGPTSPTGSAKDAWLSFEPR